MVLERIDTSPQAAADGGDVIERALLNEMLQIAAEVSDANTTIRDLHDEVIERITVFDFNLEDLNYLIDHLESIAPGSKERLASVVLTAFNGHFSALA